MSCAAACTTRARSRCRAPGTAGAPIVIRSYAGETAILDGGDPATFTWAAQGGGVYRATVNVADPHLVTANGQRLYPYQSLADLQSLIWGIPGFYASGTTVYVRLAGDANPNSADDGRLALQLRLHRRAELHLFHRPDLPPLRAGRLRQGDLLQQRQRQPGAGLHLRRQRPGHRPQARLRAATSSRTTRSTTPIFDWPWDAVKAGSDLETGGVRFYRPVTGRGNVIRRNTFHDYFDGFGVCPEATAGVTNETDVYENLVYNAGDDGMETDGTCSNVRIWGNTFHDVLMGISLAPVYTGPVYAIRNLIYRTGVGNNDYPGSRLQVQQRLRRHPARCILFHNTVDAVLPGNNGLRHQIAGRVDADHRPQQHLGRHRATPCTTPTPASRSTWTTTTSTPPRPANWPGGTACPIGT